MKMPLDKRLDEVNYLGHSVCYGYAYEYENCDDGDGDNGVHSESSFRALCLYKHERASYEFFVGHIPSPLRAYV